MRTVLLVLCVVLVDGLVATGQQPAATLKLVEGKRIHAIDVQVTVDGVSYDEYWNKSLDAIFAFADANADGVISDEELPLVPSARAVLLSLGTGFVPPVAAVRSIEDLVDEAASTCSRDELRAYYRRHGVGQLQIGSGHLTNTTAITATLLQMLDEDQDGTLSRPEVLRAEETLRRLDTNDDELIGVGELVPNGAYPGNWAANVLTAAASVDLAREGHPSLLLTRNNTSAPDSVERTVWAISVGDQVQDQPLAVPTQAMCRSWCVPGSLMQLHGRMCEEIGSASDEPAKNDEENGPRFRRPSRAWLTSLVDRDHDGVASQAERDEWLKLQKQLVHGHVLVSIYYGGGLFELLDSNHDAGLSIRELRSTWSVLEAADCISDGCVDLSRVPTVALFVVSQGYPESLARIVAADVQWFRLMDRNSDGDVSRREFTGSPEAFDRLDQDRDGLISNREAASAQ